MITVPRQIAQLTVAGRDLADWTPFPASDPRMPDPRRAVATLAGPWRDTAGRPAHGLYSREHAASGLRDVAVARDGWMLWKSRGPRMSPVLATDGTPSPLISHLNPLIGQGLIFGMCPPTLGWNEHPDQWKAEAVLRGLKTGAAFTLWLSSARKAWSAEAQKAGTVETWMGSRWTAICAAQRGTLASTFDLRALAADYLRVLPAELGRAVSRQLLDHAELPLLTAVTEMDELPPVITGLALGYPVDVTAGSLLLGNARPQHANHNGIGREEGAYCPQCDRQARSRGPVGP